VDKMDGSGNAYPDPEHPGVTNTDEPDTGERIIVPDAENNVWFRNKPKSELAVLDLQKVDQKSGEGLSDAVFQLQVLNSGGSYQPISAVEGFDGIKLDGTALAPHVVETYASAFSTTGTIQHLTDLPNGKYKLVEVIPPEGYVITLEEIVFAVVNGKVYLETTSEKNLLELTPAQEAQAGAAASPAMLEIRNEPGTELPHTGGCGTRPYQLGGAILVASSALIYLFRMRRRERRYR